MHSAVLVIVYVCLSARPSVRLSVTLVDCTHGSANDHEALKSGSSEPEIKRRANIVREAMFSLDQNSLYGDPASR